VQHRLQRLVGWRGHFDEDRFAFGVAAVHAVQHQAVKVDVEIGGRAKSLDQRDRAALGLFSLQTCCAGGFRLRDGQVGKPPGTVFEDLAVPRPVGSRHGRFMDLLPPGAESRKRISRGSSQLVQLSAQGGVR